MLEEVEDEEEEEEEEEEFEEEGRLSDCILSSLVITGHNERSLDVGSIFRDLIGHLEAISSLFDVILVFKEELL